MWFVSGTARAMLRVSIGYLLVIWGVDKLVNPAHGLAVSDRFYLGAFTSAGLMPVFGVAELILGALVIVGVCGATPTRSSSPLPRSRLPACGGRSSTRGAGN